MKIVNQDKEKKYNYLAAAEMGEEENYNMIDGIINNVPKPSVIEKIREYERHIAENDNTAKSNEPELCRSQRDEL